MKEEKKEKRKGRKCGRGPLSGGRPGSGGMSIPQSAARATSGPSYCSETPRGRCGGHCQWGTRTWEPESESLLEVRTRCH